MNRPRKALPILVLLCCQLALTANAQVLFGLRAGLNLANVQREGENETLTQVLPTFHVGPIVEFRINKNLGLGSGVLLSGKGFQEKLGQDRNRKVNPLYLELPISLHYRRDRFFMAAGPYIAFGVAGKIKNRSGSNTDSEAIVFGNGLSDLLRPLDMGAGLELGFGFGHIRLSASYNFGFSNIFPKDQASITGYKATHGVIGLSAAHIFNP